jgi:hypothetical protein
MNDVVSRIQRELPDTDKDRYDVAYDRGRAQARSGLLFGGVILGALSGVLGMFLLDPQRGTGRRAQLVSRAAGIRNDLARTMSGRAKDLRNRAKGAAIEAGIREPDGSTERRPDGSSWRKPAKGATRRSDGTGQPWETNQQFDDADSPGGHVPDPLTPAELDAYGAAGPVAGAATAAASEDPDQQR